MTQDQKRETVQLLSDLLSCIHRLPAEQVRVLMDVDERLRRGDLADGDYLVLQDVRKHIDRA